MKRDALIFLLVVAPWMCAFPASWELPTEEDRWRSPCGDVTLKLIRQEGKGGPFYRLQLQRNGDQPSWIGEPKPGQWIDPSWAGLAWLESAPHAWSGGRLFFHEGLFVAILDLREGTFLVNHQTEFCLKIGDLRWLYVASRGKNSFARADILGIVGEGALAKKGGQLPGDPEDPLVIHRVGKSINLQGLLLAPPIVDKETISVLVTEGDTGVKLCQITLKSLKIVATFHVTDQIPNVKTFIEVTKHGSIPVEGKAVLESLLSGLERAGQKTTESPLDRD